MRKAQYHTASDPHVVIYDRIGNTYVSSPTKRGDRKLKEMISRISRQTESSGRKNRSEFEVLAQPPQSSYTNTYYAPYSGSSAKKSRKK